MPGCARVWPRARTRSPGLTAGRAVRARRSTSSRPSAIRGDRVRILILSQYYFPEPVEKVHDLARGLVALGHSVQVLTGFPCYPLGRVYDGYRQRAWQRDEIDGVRVLRVPQIPDHSHSVVKRAIYYGSFAVSATAFGPAHLDPADVLLVYQA